LCFANTARQKTEAFGFGFYELGMSFYYSQKQIIDIANVQLSFVIVIEQKKETKIIASFFMLIPVLLPIKNKFVLLILLNNTFCINL
jgi:hypothetical protein